MLARFSIVTPLVAVAAATFPSACALDEDPVSVDETSQAVCYNPDGDPETCVPPSDPLPDAPRPTPISRTTTSITVRWAASSSWTAHGLQRRAPGGSWAAVASWSGVPSGTRTYTDGGRPSDMPICYRTWATNTSGTDYSDERCAITRFSGTAIPVNRLQLRIKVADVSDAGSSGRIGVSLNDFYLPGYNHTGLSYAARKEGLLWVSTFARGKDFTYDLMIEKSGSGMNGNPVARIETLRDITQIKLHNYSNDGLCIERIELLVNGRTTPAFSQSFGVSTCHWLDGDGASGPVLLFDHADLRGATSFTGFTAGTPSPVVSRDEIESRVEGIIGDNIWIREDVDWGDYFGRAGVEATRVDANSVHVDLDFVGLADWYLPNAEVDVDFDVDIFFDLNAAGTAWDVVFGVSNFDTEVDADWWLEVFGAACDVFGEENCITAVENEIERMIENGFTFQAQRFPFLSTSVCPSPSLTVNAGATASELQSISVACF